LDPVHLQERQDFLKGRLCIRCIPGDQPRTIRRFLTARASGGHSGEVCAWRLRTTTATTTSACLQPRTQAHGTSALSDPPSLERTPARPLPRSKLRPLPCSRDLRRGAPGARTARASRMTIRNCSSPGSLSNRRCRRDQPANPVARSARSRSPPGFCVKIASAASQSLNRTGGIPSPAAVSTPAHHAGVGELAGVGLSSAKITRRWRGLASTRSGNPGSDRRLLCVW